MKVSFPESFLWGTATSAYQIEGSPLADGAGPSTWHEFTHLRGRIKDSTNGDVACDHYRRYRSDVALMKEIGLRAYRFSAGWARIYPDEGRVNERGLDFYDRLIDGLLQAGIAPLLTIFHLEEPLWLARMGGFADRASVDHLVEYGTTLMRRYGDRVKMWCTINEPTIYSYQGYATGEFPPAHLFDLRGVLRCTHHFLLAHARLCDACAALVPDATIGISHYYMRVLPARPSREKDVRAAEFMDCVGNRAILDPLFRGTYPEPVLKRLGLFLPRGAERDLPSVRGRGTHVGINYYTRNRYRHSALIPFLHADMEIDKNAHDAMGRETDPEGMYIALMRLKNEYGNPPAMITENGPPIPDRPGSDPLDDEESVSYYRDHVAMMGKAIAEGADCRGFFPWSLLDNFEWNLGLSMRCGFVRTDFRTQERTWKKSAFWYRDLIRAGSLEADGAPPAPA